MKPTHFFGYELGSNWLKEENLVPKVHKGVMNSVLYRFERIDQIYHEMLFSLSFGKIKTALEDEKVSLNAQVNLGYCMAFNLSGQRKIKYFIGYNVKYSYSIVEFPVWDESRAYWCTSLSLGLSNRLIIPVKDKQKWVSALDINIMGLVCRPDEVRLYAQENWSFFHIVSITNSEYSAGFINNIIIVNFRTEYQVPIKNNLFFAFSYSLSCSKIAEGNEHPLRITRNNFGLGVGF